MNRMRKLKHILVVGGALVAGLVVYVPHPEQAKALQGDGYNYVLNNPGNDVRLTVQVAKPSSSSGVSSSTVGYVPNQYFVVSDSPNFSFELSGNYLFGDGQAKVEAYSLRGADQGLNQAKPLGSGITLTNNFSNWRTFNNASFGSPSIYENDKYNSNVIPRYNGKYVFLIKLVYSASPGENGANDDGRGFARDFRGAISPNGCPNSPYIRCDNYMSGYTPGVIHMQYEYLIRSSNQITSAPVTVAFGLKWFGGTGFEDYENGHAGNYFNDLRVINSTSNLCRQDSQKDGVFNADWDNYEVYKLADPNTTKGDGAGPADAAIYSQFFNFNKGVITTNPAVPGSTTAVSGGWKDGIWKMSFQGVFDGNSGSQEHAEFRIRGWNSVNLLYMGGAEFTWGNLPDCPPPPPPPLSLCPTSSYEAFTLVDAVTPKPTSNAQGQKCGYDYNGFDSLSGTSIRHSSTNTSYYRYTKYRAYVNDQLRQSSGYKAGTYIGQFPAGSNLYQNIESFDFDPGPSAPGGVHKFTVCAAGSNYYIDQVPLYRYYNSAFADYYYSRAYYPNGVFGWTYQGQEGWVFDQPYPGAAPLYEYTKATVSNGVTTDFEHTYNFGSSAPSGWSNGQRPVGYFFQTGSGANRAILQQPQSGSTPYVITVGPPRSEPNGPSDGGDGWACQEQGYKVNQSQTVANIGPGDGAQINYNMCATPGSRERLQVRVNNNNADPPHNFSRARFFVSVNGGGFQESSWSTTKGNGETITSDDATLNGQSVTDYLAAQGDGSTIRWYSQAQDMYGASDVDNLGRFFAITGGTGYAANADNTSFFSQRPTNLRVGPAGPTWSFYKKTRPNLVTPGQTTKELFDPTFAVRVNKLADGQTVGVVLTIKNTGQTATNNVSKIVDYLGSARDFNTPANFSYSRDGGATYQPLSSAMTPQKVQPNADRSNPNDSGANSDDSQNAWKMDFSGKVGTAVLNPNETIKIRYLTRADRNQGVAAPTPGSNQGNFEGSVNIGGNPNDRRAQNQNAQDIGSIINELSDAHTFVQYQENFCDPGNLVNKFIDFGLGQILAPIVRGGRGSVATNNDASGYAGGNATFTVTAGGDLQHFGSVNNANQFGGYATTYNKCGAATLGKIDWRTEMTKNISRLRSSATPKNIGNQVIQDNLIGNNGAADSLSYQSKNVWQTSGDLTIDRDTRFNGVGTLIVEGDLTVKANLTYNPDAQKIGSLGVIVLGNLTIDPAVTQMVGSYYVSDVRWSGNPFDISGCPILNPANGKISTGKSGQQLNVDGLMIAREFALDRYMESGDSPVATENIYYDGRVVSSPPPGFATFSSTQWFEIAP